MINYIVRRLGLMLPTLIGITLMVFSIMALAPGGVGASLLTRGGDMRPEERAAMEAYVNERYGLDKPLPHRRCSGDPWVRASEHIHQL